MLWAWGANNIGQLGQASVSEPKSFVQVIGLTGVTYIAAGFNYSLAVKSNGTVWGWGNNSDGELGDDTRMSRFAPVQAVGLTDVNVVAAGSHSMAITTNGILWEWGGFWNALFRGHVTAPLRVNELANITAISAGHHHSIALRSDGTVWTWGWNNRGQLGDGTLTSRLTPRQVVGLTGVTHIAAGFDHSLALMPNGTVMSWGQNASGQLGNDGVILAPSHPIQVTPVQVTELINVTALSAGADHSVALKSDGTVWAWGSNIHGQIGDRTEVNRNIPVQVRDLTNTSAVSAGGSHNIVLRLDGTLWGWGNNSRRQLFDDGMPTHHMMPTQINNLTNITAISSGRDHNLALRSNGTVWTWGMNIFGMLGDGTRINRSIPVQVSGLTDIYAVAAGLDHNLALTTDGIVWAWGNNGNGQLGVVNDPAAWFHTSPVQVSGLNNITAISAGGSHSLALKSDGTVWAWGDNGHGQLGNGMVSQSVVIPVQVNLLPDVVAIAAGLNHSLALCSNGTVWAWGNNGSGQLGNGTTTNSLIPVQVSGLVGISSISTFGSSFALKSDGTVWAWGNNGLGQLGNGTTTNSLVPVRINELTDIVFVYAGSGHTLAVTSNGTVWAWGANPQGQLGDGTTEQRLTPVQMYGMTRGVSAAAGGNHSLVLDINGRVHSFGSDTQGQLGLGRILHTNVPIRIWPHGGDPGGGSEYASGEEIELEVKAGEVYTFVISGEEIGSFGGKVFRLTYNPMEMRLVDFAAQTRSPGTQAEPVRIGYIGGTNIEIISVTGGTVRFRAHIAVEEGMLWAGDLTIIRFEAQITGYTKLSISIE